MVKRHSFARPLEVFIDKREGWNAGDYQITNGDLLWYTDGSGTKEGTGAGIHGVRPRDRYYGQSRETCHSISSRGLCHNLLSAREYKEVSL
jgi:hypothetical protein